MSVTEEKKAPTRIVVAPGTAAAMGAGQVLSIEVGADEDVEWLWSHEPERGSLVSGYRIVRRNAPG